MDMSQAGLHVVVYPHAMAMGGSQLNAIELAGAVRDLGHEVTVVSEEGPLLATVAELGLPHVPLPAHRRRPSPATVRRLRRLVRERDVDILHGYEWPPAIDCAGAAMPPSRAAAVCTVMSMSVAPFLPASMPVVVGTRAIRDSTAARRPGPVHLIEPPIDVVRNAPGHPVEQFRATYGLDAEPGLVLGIVCRLVPALKLEGVLTAIDVVGELAQQEPVRLVIVGDGPARAAVEERVAKANAAAGRRAVILTGELFDPRAAYAAADIMLGMGGSALRALAFARPLVVQGELGFWELLTPDTCELFLRQGWYGVGTGTGGAQRLSAILRPLLHDAALRASLGEYGRRLVVDRFSLQRAAQLQLDIYRDALSRKRSGPSALARAAEGARSVAGVAGHKVRQRYRALRGTRVGEDFNAVALAQDAMRRNDQR
jgi:glycosyltransferase involved in cell wall biosynthesis